MYLYCTVRNNVFIFNTNTHNHVHYVFIYAKIDIKINEHVCLFVYLCIVYCLFCSASI